MSVDGKWQLVVDSPMGKQQLLLDVQTEGDRMTGTVTNLGEGLTSEVLDGVVQGDSLSWKMKMLKFTLAFKTTVTDDTMSGKAKLGVFGSFDVSGKRD
jgi:hypothetical protein